MLAPFACPSGKEVNEVKRSEFYATKKKFEDVRKEKSKIWDMIRALEVKENEQSSTFVNSFGEATKRYITSAIYEKQQKRLSKQIMSYIR